MRVILAAILALLAFHASACVPDSYLGSGDAGYVANSLHVFKKVIGSDAVPSVGAYWRCTDGKWYEVHAIASAQSGALPSFSQLQHFYSLYVNALLRAGPSCFGAAPAGAKTPVVNSALLTGGNTALTQFCFAMVEDVAATYGK